jgi:hypothetical protein
VQQEGAHSVRLMKLMLHEYSAVRPSLLAIVAGTGCVPCLRKMLGTVLLPEIRRLQTEL